MEIDIGYGYGSSRIVHSARPATNDCMAMPWILSGTGELFLWWLYSHCAKVALATVAGE